MEKEKEMTETSNFLKEYTRIVVETDEENPVTIAIITASDIFPADGYRVRLTPLYG